jgi:cyclic pyranopterin phosphate synthase
MRDQFGREINYLRISVTDRCNLQCKYCVPTNDTERIYHKSILSFEDITEIATIAATEFGIDKIKLTGGEPLLRKDVSTLVKMLAAIPEIKDLAMTTNGTLLAKYAYDLRLAGLARINISLDTTDAAEYKCITQGGNIRDTFAGIAAARKLGFAPIKLNCTILSSENELHAQTVKKYAKENNFEVRFIKRMNFATGNFAEVYAGGGGDCLHCNRLRLLSDGRIVPCLFSDLSFDTKKLGIRKALTQAIYNKPEKGLPCKRKYMIDVGG